MRRWFAGLCLCVAMTGFAGFAFAQPDVAAHANDLYNAGKRLDALPLYEELATAHPNEWIYQERLADCLSVKAKDSAPDEAIALRTKVRDAARRAVELGDPNAYIKNLADLDPNNIPGPVAPASAGGALIEEAEKAFRAGDYPTALAKYTQAADADPQLYEAPLWAGDMEFRNKNAAAAGKWFARAIQINPNRETAWRYWGDTLLRVSNDPVAAKEKYIAAIIAEPYNRLAWQGIQNWAVRQKAVLLAPKIDRPAGPVVDPNKPNNLTINIDPGMTDEKKHPGGAAWLGYSLTRAAFRGETFSKDFPDEKIYRHTLKEESDALNSVVSVLKGNKADRNQLDESLRNLIDLSDAGMLDCWILINGADQGIAQDYPAYRQDHRQLLDDYIAKFIIHGGSI